MPWKSSLGSRAKAHFCQRLLPFLEQSIRRQRTFKRIILVATLVMVAGMFAATPAARYRLRLGALRVPELLAREFFGLEPDRTEVEEQWRLRRQRGIGQTFENLSRFYTSTTPENRELFRVAGMDPEHALIRYGRGDQAFVISPQVFEPDDRGRSYHFRPKTRSIWLRQITVRNGPFAMFQVLDTPVHRAAASRIGAIAVETSVQNTNSWGLRGPEPEPAAPVRGIVLGDSFMQGMFNGDADTPPLLLEHFLEAEWKVPVSVLNTGHIGYSPEQYYYSLLEYVNRFPPHFVVVSVCPNDLGEGFDVLAGKGDWYKEAEYWLGQIGEWCRSHSVEVIIVVVPTHVQVQLSRHDALYPGKVCEIAHCAPSRFFSPLDEFIDEHLRLMALSKASGPVSTESKLYNREISDDHFSPAGASFWARLVGRRLARIFAVKSAQTGRPFPKPLNPAPPVTGAHP